LGVPDRRAVPTYVINDRYGIVGAQPYEVFKSALEQTAKETPDEYSPGLLLQMMLSWRAKRSIIRTSTRIPTCTPTL